MQKVTSHTCIKRIHIFFTRKHPQQGGNTQIPKLPHLRMFVCKWPSIEQTTKILIETLTDSKQNIQPSERAWPKTCLVWYLDSEWHIFHMLRVMVEYVPQKLPSIWNCRNALRRFQKKCCKQVFYIRNKGLATNLVPQNQPSRGYKVDLGLKKLKQLHIIDCYQDTKM